jgi:hypothetical protein
MTLKRYEPVVDGYMEEYSEGSYVKYWDIDEGWLNWKKWPNEKPATNGAKTRLAKDIKDGSIYLKGTSPKHWSKEFSFYFAEIPLPEGDQ